MEQVIGGEEAEILVGHGKVRPAFGQLQDAVGGHGTQMSHGLVLKESFELRHVVAREHLLREVADAHVFVKVLLPARFEGVGLGLQIVVVQDGVDGEEGEHEDAGGPGDADGLVDGPVHPALAVEMVHGPHGQGEMEGVILPPPKIQGVPLDRLHVGVLGRVGLQQLVILWKQLHRRDPMPLLGQGRGIPARTGPQLQHSTGIGSHAADVGHGGQKLQLAVAAAGEAVRLPAGAVYLVQQLRALIHGLSPRAVPRSGGCR